MREEEEEGVRVELDPSGRSTRLVLHQYQMTPPTSLCSAAGLLFGTLLFFWPRSADATCASGALFGSPRIAGCDQSCLGGSCQSHVQWEQAQGKSCSDALVIVKADCRAGECSTCGKEVCKAQPPSPPPPGGDYVLNFDTTPDYLGISAGLNLSDDRINDYYYMVIGDWGDGDQTGCNNMQVAVAARMQKYAADRAAKNPRSKLLFVLAVGDNFYWVGLDDRGSQLEAWKPMYGKAGGFDLTSVPWFAVMGNHDWGNSDPTALCRPAPRFTCDKQNRSSAGCGGKHPYLTDPEGVTAYAGNQLDAGKQGSSPQAAWRAKFPNYVMPDSSYYYQIPALDFEVNAVEASIVDSGGLGGDGCNGGARAVCAACGGPANLAPQLAKMNRAGEAMLARRARESTSANVAIINHYPGKDQQLRNDFLKGAPRDPSTVLTFSGHEHDQRCEEKSAAGGCVAFVTGGGGGCCTWDLCKSSGPLGGFTAIAFKKESGKVKQYVECFADAACSVTGKALGLKPLDSQRDATCRHTNDAGCGALKGVSNNGALTAP